MALTYIPTILPPKKFFMPQYETVLEYERPQLDPKDADARRLIKEGQTDLMLYGGYISLQSESHPVEFRKVEIRKLAE